MKHKLPLLTLLGLLCCGAPACNRREAVETYHIPKQAAIEKTLPGPSPSANSRATSGPQRMLGAIIAVDRQAWFFKVTGPDEPVAERAEAFMDLIRSVKFSAEGDPSWSLPDGWKQQAGSGMRFATLQIGSSELPLELTVIPLAIPDDDMAAYVLSNVNRWRGQLGLTTIAKDELPENSVQMDLGDMQATLVNIRGQSSSAGAGRPSFAGHPPITGAPAGTTPSPARDPENTSPTAQPPAGPLSYDTPAGWIPGQSGGMRKAAFQVREGDAEVEITVIDLAAAAGEPLSNINRWRDQVKLPPITAEDLPQETRPIDFAGVSGKFVQLVAPDDASPRETILGVIALRGDKSWFVKLKGDAALAKREEERFEAFVKSIRFPGGEEN